MKNIPFPLHPAQRDIYTDQLIDITSAQYNIGGYIKLKGRLDKEKLHHAVASAPSVFDAFKIRFDLHESEPICYFQEDYESSPMEDVDFSSNSKPVEQAIAWMQKRFNTPFQLQKDQPLFEQCLLKIADDEHWFFGRYHHLMADGYGFVVWIQYMAKKYQSLLANDNLVFSYPSYKEELIKANDISQLKDYEIDGDYWKEKINTKPQNPLLKKRQHKSIEERRSITYILNLTPEQRKQLEEIQVLTKSGLQQLTIAALLIYLGKTSDQSEFIFGIPVHKRNSKRLRSVVGTFTGILPFKGVFAPEQKLEDFLKEITASQRTDYRHQNYLVGDLSRHLKINASEGYLSDIIINYEPLNFDLDYGDQIHAVIARLTNEDERNPLKIVWRDYNTEQPLQLHVHFSNEYFSKEEIELLAQRIIYILSQFPDNIEKNVGGINILPANELSLLEQFNNTATTFPAGKTIIDLFEQQVLSNPQGQCLVFQDQTLTYEETNERSNQLASYLLSKGVKEDTLVAICMDRSLEMIIAILGILKAGGAYLPIDPDYPAERIDYMLEDSAAGLILTSKDTSLKLPVKDYNVIVLEGITSELNKLPITNHPANVQPHHLAYVIYTSGSTGKPKGVMVEHRGVVNLALSQADALKLSVGTKTLQFASIGFDASCYEIFNTLLSGGCLVLCTKEDLLSAERFEEIITNNQVEVAVLPPSYQHIIVDHLGTIKTIVSAGEPLNEPVGKLIQSKGIRLVNAYGPTENTVCASLTDDAIKEDHTIVIGKPISNVQVYIVNNENELSPIGAIGEICLAGAQVARGYLNRADLTAEKFIQNPFDKQNDSKLYKTGDTGRWLTSGEIEYFGRIDDQLKIRGYRIEPGEIESVLEQSELVKQAVVLAREDKDGSKHLVGYILPEGSFDKQSITSFLEKKLPEYMVPSILVEVDSFPTTSSGKIDKKALPDPDVTTLSDKQFVAPSNEIEKNLAEIWQDLLGLDQIGMNDNFFELGGDSIISIQVLSRARKLGYQFEVGDIFTHQTIAAISKIIKEDVVATAVDEEESLTGLAELLPIQSRYFESASNDLSHYNQSVLLEIDKNVTESTLTLVVEKIIAHHDALRFKYYKKDGKWQQEYTAEKGALDVEDLQSATLSSLGLLIGEKADVYQKQLEIEKGKLTRWVLIKTPEAETNNRLLIVIHHLVVDGVSWRILLDDINHLISQVNDGTKISLGAKGASYQQWYEALEEFAARKKILSKVDYWQKIVQKYQPLPTDKSFNDVVKAKDIDRQTVTLSPKETTQLLQEVPRVYHTEINDILLSALAKTLCEWSNTSEVVIGLESHGRERITAGTDISNTVGWFTSLYPFVLEGGKTKLVDDLIKTVKEQLRLVPEKGLGYGVLKYIRKEKSLQNNEPWDIVFNYLGQLDNLLKESKWLSMAVESEGASLGEDQVINEKLAVNSFIKSGELVISWSFSKQHYNNDTIGQLSKKYLDNLRLFIAHCIEKGKSGSIKTPSDFGLAQKVDHEELEAFLNAKVEGKRRVELIETLYPLTGLQKGILFHGLYDRGISNTYISQFSCNFIKVDFETFNKSWQTVMQNHSVLRTAFYYDEFKVPIQCVYKNINLPVVLLDYSSMGEDEQLQAITQYEKSDRLLGFDFKAAPLMRIALIRLSSDNYRMLWTWHHILLDGWSLPILIQEFLTTYQSFEKGESIHIKEDKVYENFVRSLEEIDENEENDYWHNYLQPLKEATRLPFAETASEKAGNIAENGLIFKTIDKAESEKIKNFAQKHHLTVNTIMQGVLAFLLHKYTQSDDIAFGVTVAGRPETLEGVENSVGMYINTLPLYSHTEKNEEIIKWLQQIQQEQLTSRKYQHTPLFNIQSTTEIEGDLFDTLLVFENYPVSKVLSEGKWSLGIDNVRVHDQSNFPLTIAANDAEEIFLQFSYNRSLIQDVYADRLRRQFYHVLLQLTSETKTRLNDVTLLTSGEVEEVLNEFNNTAREYPKQKSIVDLFEEQVAATPEAIAVIFKDEQLTYKQLNERANQLARHLKNKGVRDGMLVPLCMERSIHLIVSVLGILKSGSAFVPIDTDYPTERIDFLLADTEASFVVTASSNKEKFSWNFDVEIINLNEDESVINNYSTENLPIRPKPNDLAYIIYTSGSTGKPKGVMVQHKGNVNMSLDQVRQFNITAKDRVLQFASIAFDASVSEIFMAFYAGASLAVINKEVIQNGETFASNIKDAGVTVVTLPPAYLRALTLDDLKFLRVLITAGEAADVEAATYLSNYIDYYNAYGPTECSVCVSIYKVSPHDSQKSQIAIGKPIANTKVFILNENQELLPVGVKGEIYVSGVGLAKGYLGLPELTEEKFISSPFNNDERLYRTGDVGRWLPDGNIEFLGRKDDQVKLRGYRVEPGEIEKTLEKHKDIERSVVVVNEAKEDKQLVLYYQQKDKIKLWPSVAEFYVYDDLLYKTMAGDEARNAKYRNAIRKVVKDKVILEIGPGFEAILSRICIEEGAKKVYAVELLEDSYLKAKKIVEDLGLEDKIIVIHDDITKVELPEKVDYCVSEIVGAIGGAEGSATLINASRHLLKDPSCMIPSRSLTKIAAITLPEDEFDCGFEELGAYYTSKIFEQAGHKFDLRVYLSSFPTRNIISNYDTFEDLDYTIENKLEDEHEVLLKIDRDTTLHGFIVWLNLYTDPQELIDTVDGKYTWLPIYFPVFFNGEQVAEGDYIKANITRKLSSNKLNPDFFVEGTLVRKDHKELPFTYESLYCSDTYKGNDFYAKIFEDDQIKIVNKLDKDELKNFLKNKLPEYMVPALFIEVDSFPVTISGKIDKKALPNPAADQLLENQYVAPLTNIQKKLVEIWKEVLEVEQVGIQDDFFELGGHSLLAIRLISVIREELNIEIAIADIFDYPTIESFSNHLESKKTSSVLPAIELTARPEKIPLSYSQERLWFIDKLEGSVQYHSPGVLNLKGKLNIDALQHALQTLIKRHEALRTVFLEQNGHPYQFVKDGNQWRINFIDGSIYNKDEEGLQQYVQQLISIPFDLTKDFMMRANLIKLDEQEHVLVVVTHHIASDAWSLPIIIKEVAELYESYLQDRKTSLQQLNFQYSDYAIWQRNYLSGEVLQEKLSYWKNKLDGVVPLQLPLDYSRPVIKSNRGASSTFKIDHQLAEQLNELSRQQGATLYMTLLAAFNVMLNRYSGQTDIAVGGSVANRSQQEIEGLVGFFVNTLAYRTELNSNFSFADLLQQVRTTTLEAYEHQDVPFEKVVEAVVKDRDPSISPLFQVMLVLVNTPEVPQLRLGDVVLSPGNFTQATVKFDITFFITEGADGLQGLVEYSTDLYSGKTISQMMSHFVQLLRSITSDPLQKVGTLSMMSEEEHQKLLNFNDSSVIYPADATITSLFEAQVQKTPQATALVYNGETLSYEQLNAAANRLAHYLRQKGVKEDTLVPVFVERSIGLMTAILGILKAGAAYVPIDTDFPGERISYMLKDSGSSIVISSKESRSKLETAHPDTDIITIDGAAFNDQPTTNPTTALSAHHLAYVIYTSGSTGQPKGVMIEHRNLVDYVYGLNQQIQVDQSSSYALVSSIATDLGNTVIYSSLVFGGALHLFSKEQVSNIEYLHTYFQTNEIDCLKIVPSHWKALSLEGALLLPKKLLVFGGEALQSEIVEDIKASGSGCKVINHYGPTETTIGKLLHITEANKTYNATIPIGKPFSNTRVFILSKELQLSPAGVPGQLYIAGDGVARGYLNNEELTQQKFIQSPFTAGLMYGTGDLVKYLPDGNIEFIGRADDQVKIRGYRVEIGEIESILQQSELVSQAVVMAREDKQGNKRLVGYVVAEGYFEREEILSYLKEKLPEYMVPSILVELESLPLTANGKVDRKALPDPDATEVLGDQYVAPRTDGEARLAEIWQDVLEVDQVGIHDDFFELGGHSLLAVRLISAIRKAFVVEIPISHVFDYPTVAQLASQLNTNADTEVLPPITAIHPRPQHIPLSFSQERLWFIDKLEGSVQYHVPAVLRLKGKLNTAALQQALQAIVDRHEVLRTVFLEGEGKVHQHIKKQGQWHLSLRKGEEFITDRKGLEAYIQQIINKPFNLSSDDMIRAELIELSEQENILVVTIHHIASDGWSRSVLVKELVELYEHADKSVLNLLPGLSIQYADYAIWQQHYLQGDLFDKKIGYWKEKLHDVTPLQLPTDFVRPAIWSTKGSTEKSLLNKELSTELIELSHKQGATLFMTLLSAFNVLLHHYTGQNDICVGTPIAGRRQQEVENLIGFFVNTLAIRNTIDSDTSFNDVLSIVKTTMLEAYEHQEVPFEKVVDEVVKERDLSYNPLFQVMFVLRNTPDVPELIFGDVSLSVEAHEHTTSTFDIQFFVTETTDGLDCLIEYNTDLYRSETIQRMLVHFEELLKSVVKMPQQKVGALSLLSKAEEGKLLQEFNNTQIDFPTDVNLVQLFEKQVVQTPLATAVVFENESLTYNQLNERVNQLAHFLAVKGVKQETLVPLFIERSVDMIVSILAILKAGGAYVPIDPEYPAERVKFMIEDCGADLVITNQKSIGLLPSLHLNILDLDLLTHEISQFNLYNLNVAIKPENLAYVIFTSGSTGKPKGVMNEHGGIVNRLLWAQQYFELTPADSVLQKTTFSFDVSVWELLWPLITGARLVFSIPGGHKDNRYLKRIINSEKITLLHFVPSMLEVFLSEVIINELPTLQKVLCSGEALKPSHVKLFTERLPGVELHNLYGPTEAAIDVTCWTLPTDTKQVKLVPIGKPVANTSIFILNSNGKLAPIGIAGEIHIGGVQVARGYKNREDLTEEKFIENPFENGKHDRLYKTGDLGRWLPDGNIEYIGRKDEQVKIRGFRIELGEIETAINQLGIADSNVTIARQDDKTGNKLVTYYIPSALAVKLKERQLYEKVVSTWKDLYDSEYSKTELEDGENAEFNIIGWNDSFTGNEIPAEDMREWLDDIMKVVFAEDPKNVLEIGSGTGLVYYQLAGKVAKYIGTDFSKSSINQIKNRISRGERDYGPTELHVAAAHNISLNENEAVNTIIINSVVQYFPSQEYVTNVIEQSIALLKGNGRIIIGDVRDNRLLHLFKGRLQLNKLQGSTNVKEFNWVVQQDVLKEEELCFSPDYFYSLKQQFPEISHVGITWKNVSFINELSLYRYTVVIHVGDEIEEFEPTWQSGNGENGLQQGLNDLNEDLAIIAIKDVPNPRLKKERQLVKALQDKTVSSVGDILSYVEKHDKAEDEIETLLTEAALKGYQYQLLMHEDPLKVNVLLTKEVIAGVVKQPYRSAKDDLNNTLTNIPLFKDVSILLSKDIKASLKEILPEYMVPSEMIALNQLPLTANGKVDTAFLKSKHELGDTLRLNYEPPSNEVEKSLVEIWQELLGLDRIGIHDNFFDLGGHSLLAIRVIAAVRDRWDVELLAKDIFQYNTISELGRYLEIQLNVYSVEDDSEEFETVSL